MGIKLKKRASDDDSDYHNQEYHLMGKWLRRVLSLICICFLLATDVWADMYGVVFYSPAFKRDVVEEEIITTTQELTIPGADFKIRVSGLGEGEEATATLLDDEYYSSNALDMVENGMEGGRAKLLGLIDLSIVSHGESIEPDNDVQVEIVFDKDIGENKKIYAVHFPGTGNEVLEEDEELFDDVVVADSLGPEDDTLVEVSLASESESTIIEAELIPTVVDGCTASFTASSFSYYAIVSYLTQEYISDSGECYEVTVAYTEDAGIPDGAKLKVTEFEEGSVEYNKAMATVVAQKGFIDGFAAFDIAILDSEEKEIEPRTPVEVSIRIKTLSGVENLESIASTLEIQHHKETDAGIIIENVSSGNTVADFEFQPEISSYSENGTENIILLQEEHTSDESVNLSELGISFEIDAFSTFSVTWSQGIVSRRAGQLINDDKYIIYAKDANNGKYYAFVPRYNSSNDPKIYTREIQVDEDGTITSNNIADLYWIIKTQVVDDLTEYQFSFNHNNRTYYLSRGGVNVNLFSQDTSYGYNKDWQTTWWRQYENYLYSNDDTFMQTYNGTARVWNVRGQDEWMAKSNIYFASQQNQGTATIHYVDVNGTELTVSNQNFPANNDDENTYMIYDIDGYEYSYTYINSPATKINPILYSKGRMYSKVGENAGRFLSNGDNIYLVYKKKETPSVGGIPKVYETIGKPESPKILKNSKENGDGTNTLSLSIIGDSAPAVYEKLADVIVIMDISGSMNYKMGEETTIGGQQGKTAENSDRDSRLYNAYKAINDFSGELLGEDFKNNDGDPLIRMSLITFSDRAQIVHGFTSSQTELMNEVKKMTAIGGTNWQEALRIANTQFKLASDPNHVGEYELDPNRATFIIFVTDGSPTWRLNRYDVSDADFHDEINSGKDGRDISVGSYTVHNVFGPGDADYYGKNYAAALEEANLIVKNNKILYSVGISSTDELNTLKKLLKESKAGEDHAIIASNATDLSEAFQDIVNKIKGSAGQADVKMTDGITDLTNTVDKAGLPIDGSFKYYKTTAPENWNAWTDEQRKSYEEHASWVEWNPSDDEVNLASYNQATGAVEWNMGDKFMLEKNTIYKVEFICWPKQEAFDILANLNNGEVEYADIDKELQKYFYLSGGKYVVKTNKDGANTTYKEALEISSNVHTTGNDITLPFQTVDPMSLKGENIIVKKNWKDIINPGHRATKVKFHLLVDGKIYQKDGTFKGKDEEGAIDNAYVIQVNEPTWEDRVAIAPGVIRGNDVLELGHSYSLEEFEATGGDNYGFNFTFESDIVRPMAVNDELMYFIEDGSGNYTINNREYNSEDGTKYFLTEGNTGIIQGTNYKTGELDITKKITPGVDVEKTEEELNEETFTYRVKLIAPKDSDVSGVTAYEYIEKATQPNSTSSPFSLYGYANISGVPASAISDDITRFSGENKYIYWTVKLPGNGFTTLQDGTKAVEMDITLKQNEVIRFTNLPIGTEYTIEEMYANYRRANPSRDADAVPSSRDSNLGSQGYTVTKITTKDSSSSEVQEYTNTNKVSGIISKADTRYYNQFTNNLGDAVDTELNVTKHLSNYAWNGEKYYFKLVPADSNTPMPNSDRIYISNASGTEDKTYGFGTIRFVSPGIYSYTIKEVDANGNDLNGTTSDMGIIYDTEKAVSVTVVRSDGKLVISNITGDNTVFMGNKSYTTVANTKFELKLKKISSLNGKRINDATFEIWDEDEKLYIDAENNLLTIAQVKQILGEEVDDGIIAEANIRSSFSIGEIKLKGIEFGKEYTLKEISAPSGYVITHDEWIIKAQNSNTLLVDGEIKDVVEVLLENEPGASLPATGGPGIHNLYLFGILLTAFAVLTLLRRTSQF